MYWRDNEYAAWVRRRQWREVEWNEAAAARRAAEQREVDGWPSTLDPDRGHLPEDVWMQAEIAYEAARMALLDGPPRLRKRAARWQMVLIGSARPRAFTTAEEALRYLDLRLSRR